MSWADSVANWSIWEQEEMRRKHCCNHCDDKGTIGLLHTDGWIFMLMEMFFTVPVKWIEQVCPKCKGNPQPSKRPPPPQGQKS